MKNNMGMIDRVVRLAIAAVIGILYVMGSIHGILALILGVVAVIFVATSVMGFCPLYLPLNLSTKKEK